MRPIKIASIEVTNICNYRCSKCFHGHNTFNKEKKFIENDTFRKIVKKLPEYVTYIGLSGIGEPLIHPKFFELVDICKEERPSCLVGFHTNGSLITNEIIEEILKRENIDDINISIDAIQNQTHKNIHNTKIEINDILIAVGKMLKRRKEVNSKLRITTSFVIQKENIKELVPFILAMKGLEVDYIGPINLINPLPGYEIEKWENRYDEISIELEKAEEIAKILNIKLDLPKIKNRKFGSANMEHSGRESCSFPFELYPIIDCFGNIYHCVWLQFNKKYIMGNILTDSLQEIYKGKKISATRRILQNDKYFPECINCNPGGIQDNNISIEEI